MIDFFDEALAKYKRIAITGGPRSGKTTLSQRVSDRRVVHTDDYKDMGWSECSLFVCTLVNSLLGPLVVEGVAVPRAMRKGMLVDAVIWLDAPLVGTSRHHRSMREGIITVMNEVRQDMKADWIFAPPRQIKEAIRSDR